MTMEADTAIAKLHNLALKPGWKVEASKCPRFDGTVKVTITYPARNSDKANAPDYDEEVPGGAKAQYRIPVGQFDNDLDLYRKLIHIIAGTTPSIEQHEWREFLRVKPSMEAPFHPHKLDGMERWGDPEGDYLFGVA